MENTAKLNRLETLQDCLDRVSVNGRPIAVGRLGAYSVRVCTPGNMARARKQYYRVKWASIDGRSNTFTLKRENHPALGDKTHKRISEMVVERIYDNRN